MAPSKTLEHLLQLRQTQPKQFLEWLVHNSMEARQLGDPSRIAIGLYKELFLAKGVKALDDFEEFIKHAEPHKDLLSEGIVLTKKGVSVQDAIAMYYWCQRVHGTSFVGYCIQMSEQGLLTPQKVSTLMQEFQREGVDFSTDEQSALQLYGFCESPPTSLGPSKLSDALRVTCDRSQFTPPRFKQCTESLSFQTRLQNAWLDYIQAKQLKTSSQIVTYFLTQFVQTKSITMPYWMFTQLYDVMDTRSKSWLGLAMLHTEYSHRRDKNNAFQPDNALEHDIHQHWLNEHVNDCPLYYAMTVLADTNVMHAGIPIMHDHLNMCITQYLSKIQPSTECYLLPDLNDAPC